MLTTSLIDSTNGVVNVNDGDGSTLTITVTEENGTVVVDIDHPVDAGLPVIIRHADVVLLDQSSVD